MGYNSVLFLCNDAIDQIDRDPAGWWKKARLQLMRAPYKTHEGSVDRQDGVFGFGNHANGFQAVWNRHADEQALIAVGGNYATVLKGSRWTWGGHHTEEGQVELLKLAAKELGYELRRKKPKSKK